MLLEIGLLKRKKQTNKQTKKIKIALSLGYPNSYFIFRDQSELYHVS